MNHTGVRSTGSRRAAFRRRKGGVTRRRLTHRELGAALHYGPMLIECARCGKPVAPTDDCCSACGFDPVNDPCRFGPYELLERRGRGGLSVVFKARLDGTVAALKILESTRPKRLDQFAREISVLSSLSHPNIVKMHDS